MGCSGDNTIISLALCDVKRFLTDSWGMGAGRPLPHCARSRLGIARTGWSKGCSAPGGAYFRKQSSEVGFGQDLEHEALPEVVAAEEGEEKADEGGRRAGPAGWLGG